MIALSVCICTFRRANRLDRLLRALATQLGEDREILVVNDGSHDEAYEKVAERHANHIRYLSLEKNVGIAQARNVAARAATGEFIVYIDDDCEPPAWWLDWLQARLDAHPELDVVAGPTLALPPESGETFASRFQAHFGFLPQIYGSGGNMIFPAANLCIRATLLSDIGMFGFTGPFFGAGEDTELAVRAQLAGARMLADETWHVRHDTGEPVLSLAKRYYRYGYSNGAITALATSPESHAMIYRMRYSRLHEQLRHFITRTWTQSATFPGSATTRMVAFLAALTVHMAYQVGCIRGKNRMHARNRHPTEIQAQ